MAAGISLVSGCLGVAAIAASVPAGAKLPAFHWVERQLATRPFPRTFAAMAYDATSEQVLLTGGTSQGSAVSTTWAWNGTSWANLRPAASPPARTGASMAYDSTTKQAVLFGGYVDGHTTATTWVWDGTTWTNLTASLTPSPPARAFASMAYDPQLGEAVLFGGSSGSTVLGTTWAWNGSAWSMLTVTPSPPARTTASMAYDAATHSLVLFGGLNATASTWQFDGTWSSTTTATGPPDLYGASMAYDAQMGKAVLFGGDEGGTESTATWAWDGTDWTELATPAHPPGGLGASMAYDTASDQAVLFGGSTPQTWTWQATSTGNPPGAPTAVEATRGTSSVTVSWTAPATDGGTPVTAYAVEATPGTEGCTTTGALTCTVSGLTNGIEYSFTVAASSNLGTGPSSTPPATATPAGKPTAPTTVGAAIVHGHLVKVSWSGATGNGAPVTGYQVMATTAPTVWCTTTGTSCTVVLAPVDVPYDFRVTAFNGVGSSPPSTRSAEALIPGAPAIVGTVVATPGNRFAAVRWPAARTEGTAVLAYKVTSTTGKYGCSVLAPALTCTVTGLTNGTAYAFWVVATNGVGTSTDSSTSNTVTPATAPFAPTTVGATRGDGKATVNWNAATANGSPVTKYTATSSPGTLTCTTTGALSCTVTGLTNGKGYTFSVVATNTLGSSPRSVSSSPVTPAGAPEASTAISAVPGDQSATVRWTPATGNGTAVSGYTVTSSPGTETCATSGALNCVVKGLTNGTAYRFSVVATNGVGPGAPSAGSAAVTPAGVPGAPSGATAVDGDRSAAVTWDPATADGSAITGYTVTSVPAQGSCRTTGALTCTVGGLVNGTAYSFTVTATNLIGTGTASAASNSVTPDGVPRPPTQVATADGPTSITLSWSAPTDNGSPVTSYEILRGPATGGGIPAPIASVAGTTFTDSSALPGTVYAYEVEAQNSVGPSLPSTKASAEVFPPGALGSHMAALAGGQGYWVVHRTGGVTAYGGAQLYGSLPHLGLSVDDIVGIAPTPDGRGYWLVGVDGGVFAFGDAAFEGSLGTAGVSVSDIVGIASTRDGGGYWLFGADGGVFAFGDAQFCGSTGGIHLNQPIVGMATTPTGAGYWLVASDGGVFAFGDAQFHGSIASLRLNRPIVAITPTRTGGGYWLVASDGGIFDFTAPFYGSTGGAPPSAPVVGVVATPTDRGYSVVDATGTSFRFAAS
jgi:hypothetical protein